MPKPTPSSHLSQWLDKLQQESWQLELLISGFVIFLLIGGLEPFHQLEEEIARLSLAENRFFILSLPYHTLRMAYYVLLFSLLLHVTLRGLWISTIGLRYVSGGIDFEQLALSDRFANWLEGRIGSFDLYIEKLERTCSVLFAYTFLLIFSILGVGMFMLGLLLVQITVRWLADIPVFQGAQGLGVDDWLMFLYLLMGVIYVIDFITLGWVKRRRVLGRIYFPIYRLMSFITFASLYRPIYYNLIDNRYGRRLAYLIVPTTLLLLVLVSLQIVAYGYLPLHPRENSTSWYLVDQYVAESGADTNPQFPSLESRFVGSNYLRIFLPYLPSDHDRTIQQLCPDLEPGRFTGLKLRGGISAGVIDNATADTEQLLACMRQLWQIHVDDSLYTDIPIRFYEHPVREQPGLEAVVPIHHLAATEHIVRIDRQRYFRDSLQVFPGRELYFYKE